MPGDRPGGFYVEAVAHLRKQGPSSLDAELRALGPWQGMMESARHFITRILTPLFLREITSYDVASTIHQSLPHRPGILRV